MHCGYDSWLEAPDNAPFELCTLTFTHDDQIVLTAGDPGCVIDRIAGGLETSVQINEVAISRLGPSSTIRTTLVVDVPGDGTAIGEYESYWSSRDEGVSQYRRSPFVAWSLDTAPDVADCEGLADEETLACLRSALVTDGVRHCAFGGFGGDCDVAMANVDGCVNAFLGDELLEICDYASC